MLTEYHAKYFAYELTKRCASDSFEKLSSTVPYNPLISEPLFWARYIERAGTGTLDMITLCRKKGIPEPEFEQRGGQFVLTIRRKKVFLQKLMDQSATQSTDPVVRILHALMTKELSAGELRSIVKIKHRPTFRANYLHPALKSGFIEYTIPDKSNSRLQKYRITGKGKEFLKLQENLK